MLKAPKRTGGKKMADEIEVYITKYALTKGILKVKGRVATNISDTMFVYKMKGYETFSHKPDWHNKLEDALVQANKMRQKKIISLQKQIDKIKAMNFNDIKDLTKE